MIRAAAALALLALLAPSTSPAARDVGSMYDERVLSPWRERYQAKLDDVYGGPVWRALTPAERRRLEGVRIEVPLMATGEARGDPFVFYAEPGPPGRVVMPALSIYFFEELLGAFAWLAQRGDDPAVVGDYLAMLKYQGRERFEGDRYPTPFEALGVPEAAWRDRYVLEFARGGLKTAVLYILAHELGHHVRGHLDRAPDSAAASQLHEEEADAFAIELLRRVGEPPVGAVLWFQFAQLFSQNRADFGSEAAWREHLRTASHPITASRLRHIAGELRAAADDFAGTRRDQHAAAAMFREIADDIGEIAELAADAELTQGIAARGASMDARALAPRPKGGLEVAGIAPRGDGAFAGVYSGGFTYRHTSGGIEEAPARFVFQRSGERVYGRIAHPLGVSEIDGVVRDGRLVFRWRHADEWGSGMLVAAGSGDGEFTGSWGYGESSDNAGRLAGRRER